MTLEEKKKICSCLFIAWFTDEREKNDNLLNTEVYDLFTAKMISKKFEAFNIDIVLPAHLLAILDICVDGNPGQFQIVLKDLLNSIKERKGLIPAGYTITTDDFSMCFMFEFPIIEIPKINDKYLALWNKQKITDKSHILDSDNLCDTPEWWKDVMA